MASKVPYDLILTQLKATLPGVKVAEWDSVTDLLSQPSTTFVTVDDSFSDNRLQSIGSPSKNWFEETGEIDVHIFVPAASGYGAARTVADTIASGLRMKYLSGTTRTKLVSPPNAGDVADGLWTSMIVAVEYVYNYTAPTSGA
jgi:hypothetical protein